MPGIGQFISIRLKIEFSPFQAEVIQFQLWAVEQEVWCHH